MQELEIERKKLEQTLKIIGQILIDEKIELENLYRDFVGSRDELWAIADQRKIHIKNLETSSNKPYFARIDFVSEGETEPKSIYIGKNGVIKDMKNIVTDWRAPISSLYYDAEVGNCSYQAPDGQINGEMTLKRQYEIEDGKLIEYFDVDLVSNDSLLQKYLNSNNDNRLKSIVATIQKEQNEVIRRKLYNNLIIQGVAGSGKTTVALHRIAYLVYNYINSVKQDQYLVIGPNPVFLKYIKSVLPELDVSGVKQCTFEELVKEFIEEDININPSDKKVLASIAGKKTDDIEKFKCSIKYKNMLDKFLEVYFSSLTCNDLLIDDFKVLDQDVIAQAFESINTSNSSNLNTKVERTIDYLCRYIETNKNSILLSYNDYCYEKFKTATTEKEKNNLRKQFLKAREEIIKNCRGTLRKYFSKSKLSCIKLYKLFVSSISDFDIYKYSHLKTLKKEVLANIKNDSYDFEDLAALMYLKQNISPNKYFGRFKHVIIDEAQDLGEFNFLALKKSLPSATFSIFGDLAQSIYDYRGIDSWDDVNKVMFENEGEIVNFNKSYRTTSEIMNVADNVSDSIGLGRSDLVVRNGSPVKFTGFESDFDIPRYIADKIKEYKAKGYKTIAVISKTNLLSRYINDDLAARGIVIPNVDVNDDLSDERFNVCTISNQLSKGLEFDAVIINNADENIYSSESSLDMKLLYVAITRALHELDVVYTGELTKPLKKLLLKEETKQKVLR